LLQARRPPQVFGEFAKQHRFALQVLVQQQVLP